MKNKQKIIIILLIFVFVSCAPKHDYNKQLQDITQKWNDAVKIASSTSRIALSQPVAKLQEIRREAEMVKVPGRMTDCYGHLLKHMYLTIESFLSFMQDSGSLSTIEVKMAADEFIEWQLCSLPEDQAKLLKQKLEESDLSEKKSDFEQIKKLQLPKKEDKKDNGFVSFKLEGIFLDKEKINYAMINGKIVYEGANIGNVTIEKIEEDSIIFRIDGQKHLLRVGETTFINAANPNDEIAAGGIKTNN
jgi:hypothetical protein